MTEAQSEQPWRVPVAVQDVSETGRHLELAADEHTRAAIAVLAGLRALPRLTAVFDLARRGREGLRVTGTVSATAGQTCVVTLEPIESEIEEDVDLVFVPRVAPTIVEEDGAKVEIAAVDAPEELVDGKVDLGVLATEFLMLALDPYPRKAGAEFDAPPTPDDDEAHPFAVLAKLKKGQGADGE